MYEVGEAMMRQRLRRESPKASPAQIEAEIDAWLQHRPGAEHGDFPGAPLEPAPVNGVAAAEQLIGVLVAGGYELLALV